MKIEKFDEVWNNIFIKTFEEIVPAGDVYIKRFAKKKIYKVYQKEKTFLKINYMQNPNTHLDRHKIAACMMYAIVKVQPISIKKIAIWNMFVNKKKFDIKYSMLNEYLGFYTALSIIESFRDYENTCESKCGSLNRRRVSLPATTNGEDYIYNTCLDLYLSKKKNKINVLTFANVFFLLETGEFAEKNEKTYQI